MRRSRLPHPGRRVRRRAAARGRAGRAAARHRRRLCLRLLGRVRREDAAGGRRRQATGRASRRRAASRCRGRPTARAPAAAARRPAPRRRLGAAATPPRRPAAGPGQRVNLRLSFETGSADLTPAARAQARGLRPVAAAAAAAQHALPDRGAYRFGRLAARATSRCRSAAPSPSPISWSMPGSSRERLVVRGYGPDRPLPGHLRAAPARTGGSRRSGSTSRQRRQRLRDQLGQRHRLRRIEPRVAMGVIAVGHVRSLSATPPPVHSATSWPVISKWRPPQRAPSAAATAKKARVSARIRPSGRVLWPRGGADRVAVHRIAGPEHGMAFCGATARSRRRQRARRPGRGPSARSG